MNGFRIAITIVIALVIAIVLQIVPQSEVVIFKTAFRVTQIISTWRVDRKMTRSHCMETESRQYIQSDFPLLLRFKLSRHLYIQQSYSQG